MDVLRYVDARGKSPFSAWFDRLRDAKAATAVIRRLDRLASGNFGDCKPLKDGVWELRIDIGPGYRVYYAKAGVMIVVLLCGGDKKSQKADISRAVEYWRDWNRRMGNG